MSSPEAGHVASALAAVYSAPEKPAADALVIRQATPDDAPAIHALIVANLESGHLLPRSLAEVAACSPRFRVAEGPAGVLACGELARLSPSVAEVRSLVVAESARGLGVGRLIIDALRRSARADQYGTLCAFTHDPRFFVRLGFSIVPHFWLPEKVAADCWSCPHFRKCGQYAVVDSQVGAGFWSAQGERRVS
jgi:amino-acid N-acetyltransferase